MTDEHLLVQDILKQYDITIAALADQAGMADSTVYEYTGGRKKNFPMSIWRALYELTGDARITELLTGSREVFVVPVPKQSEGDTAQETLMKLIDKRRRDIECESAILEILSDGKIDRNDWKAIEQYKEVHPEAIKLSSQIYHAIIKEFEEQE